MSLRFGNTGIDRYLILVALFHTELMASVVVVFIVAVAVAVVIFLIYLFIGFFNNTEQGGELSLQKLDVIRSKNFMMSSCCISGKGF